jgi:hypothetical protein
MGGMQYEVLKVYGVLATRKFKKVCYRRLTTYAISNHAICFGERFSSIDRGNVQRPTLNAQRIPAAPLVWSAVANRRSLIA